jgi:DNA-binding response OmpR family regulator
MRAGILDTDSGFVRVLRRRLEEAGWHAITLASAVPAHELLALRLNALVLDVAPLGVDAWPYLERTCVRAPDLGLVVCTAPSTVAQRVRGLRLGVDDWMTKPCHPMETVARLESVVRRRKHLEAGRRGEGARVAGALEVRSGVYQAFANGVSAGLTRREFELLDLMVDSGGCVLERERIYERVWGYAMVPGDRSVDVYVRKLRRKLRAVSPGWDYVHTHFRIGYRFAPEPALDAQRVELGDHGHPRPHDEQHRSAPQAPDHAGDHRAGHLPGVLALP